MFKSLPLAFQRLEGAALFVFAYTAYTLAGGVWWIFLVLLLAVDVSMVGYLVNKRVGAIGYNLGHSLIIPLFLICYALVLNNLTVQLGAFIWLAHIGVDRLFGYGLKEASGFTHTHLGEIGKK